MSSIAATSGTTTSPYQAEYRTLQQQDTAELLYASFLSPSDALANGNAVLQQAAQLLGTPGSLPASTSTTANGSSTSNASSASNSAPSLPSVASILSASDAAAQQTLTALANAPAGSSIIDFQA